MCREFLVEELYTKFPLGVVTPLDGMPQITAVEIRIGAIDLDGLVPQD